jgi:hypothetical protein
MDPNKWVQSCGSVKVTRFCEVYHATIFETHEAHQLLPKASLGYRFRPTTAEAECKFNSAHYLPPKSISLEVICNATLAYSNSPTKSATLRLQSMKSIPTLFRLSEVDY